MWVVLEGSEEEIKEEKVYEEMGVRDEEFVMIESIVGRLANYTEMGIFLVMW